MAKLGGQQQIPRQFEKITRWLKVLAPQRAAPQLEFINESLFKFGHGPPATQRNDFNAFRPLGGICAAEHLVPTGLRLFE